jgi:hypothetical protein
MKRNAVRELLGEPDIWVSGRYIFEENVPAVIRVTQTPEIIEATIFVYATWPEPPHQYQFDPTERVVWLVGTETVHRYVSEGPAGLSLIGEEPISEALEDAWGPIDSDASEAAPLICPFLSPLEPFDLQKHVDLLDDVQEDPEFVVVWKRFAKLETPDFWTVSS